MRAVVAEDVALLRDGLVRLLSAHDIDVVESVEDGPSLLGALMTHRPDVAVVDVRLPPTFTNEGLQAAIEARRQVPGMPILVLSQYVEPLYARELLSDKSGGVGYLLKDRVMEVGQFVDAVRRVASGGTVMDPEVVSQLLAKRARDERPTDPARARGARAHGRGSIERGGGGELGGLGGGSQQTHRQHLHEARPTALGRGQPSGLGGVDLPELLTQRSEGWR